MSRRTLAAERLALVQKMVKTEVARYIAHELGLNFIRFCANCGCKFVAHNRWHFLCCPECRHEWNRGLFRPRREP